MNRPLVPELVSPDHPGMFPKLAPGLHDMFGYHPTWCTADPRDPGVSVEEHGEWCEKIAGCGVDAQHVDGSEDGIYVYLVEPYVHGIIHTVDAPASRNQYVRLNFGGDNGGDGWLYLSAQSARSLGAQLVHAADKLELH